MTTDRQKTLQSAADHLSKNDTRLAPIIERFGLCTLEPHDNYYHELVDSIISQQLSVKAAATIVNRFIALFGDKFPTPEQILERDIEALRAVGMSRPKASYVLDLARHIIDGKLQLEKLPDLPNEDVIRELVAVKGIGEWTAHMFLIFSLGRLDILATGDLGVRSAIKRLYGLDAVPKPDEMHAIAGRFNWHPYESVACWYLWKSLDNEPQIGESSRQ
jgi:DNA-3-methyladenine glycosylase II